MNDFINLCREKGYSSAVIDKFLKAIEFSRNQFANKKRLAGDLFIDHNIRVGSILAEHKLAPEVVLAGLLHGTEVKNQFGNEVETLLQGVREVKTIKLKNPQLSSEALRKIILTTLKDIRVIFVKLANKVDNLRSISVFPFEDQKRIAEEVLEIYAPLAYRLGMDKLKSLLEDLSFRVLYPKKFNEIVNFLEESKKQREKNISEVINLITLKSKGVVLLKQIKGRTKHIYSIYKKLHDRKVKLKEQFDLLGIRVIVPEIKDCYTLLGLLHQNFEPIGGRLKDYIANPKPNFYRSIHTCVKLPNGKNVEIQIRTEEMDEFAEEGLAAHWQYKGVKSDQLFEKKLSWLKNVLDLQKDIEHNEVLETIKVDIFGDKIYCYTPKGDVKELPHNATILDFAFLVHEEVGQHCVGARVNGKFVSLKHKLHHSDVVEIITNKNQRPRRGWIKIVKSSRARQKIRKSLKEHETLAPFHYRLLKPVIKEEQGVLVESSQFPKAVCILAKCCHPLPGNEIVGIVTKRRVISVHNRNCRHGIKEQNRWVYVNWKETFNQKIKFFVNAEERSGLLADLLHTIVAAGFEVKEAKAKLIDLNHAECSFLIVPRDLDQLKDLIGKIMKVKGVTSINFD